MKTHETFFLSRELLDSVDIDEVIETYNAMMECDVDRAPYPDFSIVFPANYIVTDKVKNAPGEVEFVYRGLTGPLHGDGPLCKEIDGEVTVLHHYKNQTINLFTKLDMTMASEFNEMKKHEIKEKLALNTAFMLRTLIVLLATKGVVKERTRDKLAKMGIGPNKAKGRNVYVTTISIGHVEPAEGEPSGKTVRPHLRRGHVRNQHYGPKNSFVRKIFVESCFVNSDKEYVGFRDRYNVSL